MDGGARFRASVREVAELAGVNKETAYKAIGRLVRGGYVSPEAADKQASSSHYSLSPHVVGDDETSPESRTVGEAYTPVGISVRNLEAHDVWHRDALGKSALACWTVIRTSQGLTEVEIAERTGKTTPTVGRALLRLEQHGLAHADGKKWRAADVPHDVLDAIALESGTLGKANQRVQRHREERERHATVIIEQQKRDWLGRQ